MAFVASHHSQHGATPRVASSDVSKYEPVRLSIGDTNVFLSIAEAQHLIAEMQREVAAVEAAARGVAA